MPIYNAADWLRVNWLLIDRSIDIGYGLGMRTRARIGFRACESSLCALSWRGSSVRLASGRLELGRALNKRVQVYERASARTLAMALAHRCDSIGKSFNLFLLSRSLFVVVVVVASPLNYKRRLLVRPIKAKSMNANHTTATTTIYLSID